MGNRKSLIFHGKTPAEKNIDGRKEVAEYLGCFFPVIVL